ncbi:MAG: PQQ-binding-like beta-propeller repeat protein, partial [Anaerolineaceae bacterium]|nr:PQQ-binding-like beta-propeller repeat protein [Anaerolineaceae bacterium]
FALDPGTGKLLWKQDVGSAMVSSPLVGTDGNLYISTFAKEVQARDTKNGKLLWSVNLEAEIWGTPVMDGDLLFVGDQKGNIYSISTTNRSFKKIDTLGSAVIASPVMVKDHVVFVSENGDVAGYKPDGSAPWKQKITGKIYTTPVFNGELLIVAVKDGDKLLVMYDSDGKEVRSFAPAK